MAFLKGSLDGFFERTKTLVSFVPREMFPINRRVFLRASTVSATVRSARTVRSTLDRVAHITLHTSLVFCNIGCVAKLPSATQGMSRNAQPIYLLVSLPCSIHNRRRAREMCLTPLHLLASMPDLRHRMPPHRPDQASPTSSSTRTTAGKIAPPRASSPPCLISTIECLPVDRTDGSREERRQPRR